MSVIVVKPVYKVFFYSEWIRHRLCPSSDVGVGRKVFGSCGVTGEDISHVSLLVGRHDDNVGDEAVGGCVGGVLMASKAALSSTHDTTALQLVTWYLLYVVTDRLGDGVTV
ncbi:hypothetical protein Pcinc_001821 [Petrolisthes cinctipes]|uniref:Uncharacterized protein n=1 Tax=Petrolisthes cinctipes TaxID=88211 RepID=A0AAE1L460_PETCI|nr:hypothetical protein Pcinc_024248 [Petrolisthes cinctipes]KAK3881863.1 hypothetical protein Pcinc_013727 [Petrolisthes cinctipes]KAK3883211.1 hypothetical protein Pcinc_012456 [Petrolisthes cinctipes]KAK3894412.1 hypothetical protein Pcinc_001821 [Petrolisthes cinctipes]